LAGVHLGQDFREFAIGINLLQLCSLAGALGSGGGGRDAMEYSSYKKSFTILR